MVSRDVSIIKIVKDPNMGCNLITDTKYIRPNAPRSGPD